MLVRTHQQINTSFVGVTQAAISYKRLKQTILSQKYIYCWVLSATLYVLVLKKRHRNISYQNPVALHAWPVQLPLVKSPALRYLHIRSREFAATIFHVTEHLDRGKSWWVKNQFAKKNFIHGSHLLVISEQSKVEKPSYPWPHLLSGHLRHKLWRCWKWFIAMGLPSHAAAAVPRMSRCSKIFFRITCFHGKKNISAFPPYHSLVSAGAHYALLQQHSET